MRQIDFFFNYSFIRSTTITGVFSTLILLIIIASPCGLYAQGGYELEEIVVTARKRDEAITDVPVSISAYSGDMLENRGINNSMDLLGYSPGLYFSQSGQRNNDEQFYLTIRGVGSSPVVEPSVGIFVDGVYMPSLGWTMDFLDVERIEILRGPQGALFGRNTEAGALQIVTRKPGEEFKGKASLEAAEFGTVKGSIFASGPLTDTLFAGISLFGSTTNGFVDNATLNQDQDNRDKMGGRLSLRAVPSENAEFQLTFDYYTSDGRHDAFGDASSYIVRVEDPNAGGPSSTIEPHALQGRKYTTYANEDQYTKVWNYGLSLEADINLNFATFTSISGYRNIVAKDLFDNDGIATANSTNQNKTFQEVISQELRLTSNGEGQWDWIVGLYGFLETVDQTRLSLFNDPPFTAGAPGASSGFVDSNAQLERDGISVFGQINYAVTEKLEIAAGARYTFEDVAQQPDTTVSIVGGLVNFRTSIPRQKTFSDILPMGSITYRWNDEVMTYASISTGFKGGGFPKEPPSQDGLNVDVDQEETTNYEIGTKVSLFDNRFKANLTWFYTELDKMQVQTRIEITPGVFSPAVTNAAAATSTGIEFEAIAQLTDNLIIDGNFAYTDAEFDDFATIPSAASPTNTEYNRGGQAFPETPEWVFNIAAEYHFHLPDMNINLTPRLSYQYVDEKYIGEGLSNLPQIDIPSYDLLNFQLTAEKDAWEATFYVRNLLDDYYVVNRWFPQPALGVVGSRSYQKPGAPRQIGFRVAYNF